MGEDILRKLYISIETAKATAYIKNGRQYARVDKHVPAEWAGEEVVIMRRKDLDRLLRYVDSIVDLVDEVISKTALRRTFMMEVQARQEAKEAANIKLARDEISQLKK